MKKIVTICIASLCLFLELNAQVSINPEIGINLSSANLKSREANNPIISQMKSKIGLRLGTYVNIPFAKHFSLEPGFFYSQRGYKTTYHEFIQGGNYDYWFKMDLNYFELPLNIVYTYRLRKFGNIFASIGGYFSLPLSGKAKQKEQYISIHRDLEKEIIFGNGGSDIQPLDYGMNIAIGYQMFKGLYSRFQYTYGMLDLTYSKSPSLHSKGFAFTLGYEIKLSSNSNKGRNVYLRD